MVAGDFNGARCRRRSGQDQPVHLKKCSNAPSATWPPMRRLEGVQAMD